MLLLPLLMAKRVWYVRRNIKYTVLHVVEIGHLRTIGRITKRDSSKTEWMLNEYGLNINVSNDYEKSDFTIYTEWKRIKLPANISQVSRKIEKMWLEILKKKRKLRLLRRKGNLSTYGHGWNKMFYMFSYIFFLFLPMPLITSFYYFLIPFCTWHNIAYFEKKYCNGECQMEWKCA